PLEIASLVYPLGPGRDFLNGCVVSYPVADEPRAILTPEFVVGCHDFVIELGWRLPIDLHDNSVGRQVGIHPIERKTLLEEKLVLWVVIENDLGQQTID